MLPSLASVATLGLTATSQVEGPAQNASDLSWCSLPRFVITHHRGGGAIANASVVALNMALLRHCPRDSLRLVTIGGHGVNYDFERHSDDGTCDRIAPDSKDPVRDILQASQLGWVSRLPPLPRDARVLLLARNPFEMAASSYAYDLQGKEPAWQEAPPKSFDHCRRHYHEHFGTQQSYLFQCTAGIAPHCAGIDAVVVASDPEHGDLKESLPELDPEQAAMAGAPTEGWKAYLERVEEDQGLLAEAVMMRALALRNMARIVNEFDSGYMSNGSRAICLNDIEDSPEAACRARWEHAVARLDFPSQLVPELAAAVAAATCPRSVAADAARDTMLLSNRTQAAKRVLRLAQLDARLLNSSLAQIAAYVGCDLSASYSTERKALLAVRAAAERASHRLVGAGRRKAHAMQYIGLTDERTLLPRREDI